MVWFIKQHVDATINECRSTQLYGETGVVDKKEVPLSRSRSLLDATGKYTHTLKPENFKKLMRQEEKQSSRLSPAPKKNRIDQ